MRTMCIRDTKCVYLAPTTCDTIVIVIMTLWFETRTFYFILCLSVRFTLATYVLVPWLKVLYSAFGGCHGGACTYLTRLAFSMLSMLASCDVTYGMGTIFKCESHIGIITSPPDFRWR